MKSKYLALGLSLALMLGMVACGHQAEQEPQKPAQEIQQTEPVTTEPTAEPMEVKQEVDTTTPSPGPEDTESGETDEADTSGESGSAEGDMVEVELFTEVNETVYATGTVNIRASWSAESEKLGSLNTGDSVTRTGTPIDGTKAEGWSRIQLSDGTVAYVSNKYLSTTKPVQQSTTTNQGSQTQQPVSSTPASGGDTTTGSQSQQNKDGWNQAFYETLTPEQKAVYEGLDASSRNMMQQDIEKTRQLASEGWITEGGDPTEEELRDAWGNIQMGQ